MIIKRWSRVRVLTRSALIAAHRPALVALTNTIFLPSDGNTEKIEGAKSLLSEKLDLAEGGEDEEEIEEAVLGLGSSSSIATPEAASLLQAARLLFVHVFPKHWLGSSLSIAQ